MAKVILVVMTIIIWGWVASWMWAGVISPFLSFFNITKGDKDVGS